MIFVTRQRQQFRTAMLEDCFCSCCVFQLTSGSVVENEFIFSCLQTFVNDLRIPDQTYITLKVSDIIRFGYDIL